MDILDLLNRLKTSARALPTRQLAMLGVAFVVVVILRWSSVRRSG